MHIAYYAPAWPPAGAANGIVTYVSAMRNELQAQGHDVSVISQGRLYAANGEEHGLEPELPILPTIWAKLRGRIDRDRGDHPHSAYVLARQLRAAHTIAPFDLIEMEESFGWSRAAQRALDVPVVTRLHGPSFLRKPGFETALQRRQSAQRSAAEGRAIRDAPALSAPTSATMEAARSHYGHTPHAKAIIPNPVQISEDADRWSPCAERDTILFVGRFDHAKGADTMLEAFAELIKSHANVRLVLVGPDTGLAIPGGGTLCFSDYAAAHLRPEVRARVEFTGAISRECIAELRQRALLSVTASRNETFHYAAVEAMAAGSPVISTKWPGSTEVIRNGTTGWLTPIDDAPQLARRIGWLLDHPEAAERVGAAAWRHCRDTYAPEKVVGRSLKFYSEVLSRHAARH